MSFNAWKKYEKQLRADIKNGKVNSFDCMECEKTRPLKKPSDVSLCMGSEDAYGNVKTGLVCSVCRPQDPETNEIGMHQSVTLQRIEANERK
jgi:hypothetical protein